MKAIRTEVVVGTLSSKKDRSCRFSAETPELTDEEFNIIRGMQGRLADILIEPKETFERDVVTVDKEVGIKSHAQRLRSVIFLVLRNMGREKETNLVYENEMEKLIDKYKDKLE